MTEPAPVKTSRAPRRGMLRRRSLLWVVSERRARVLGWAVVLACVVSLAAVVTVLWPGRAERHEGALAEALSTHLAMPVQVKSAELEESGQYTFSDIAVGEKGSVLRAASGSYTPPRDDTAGRLSLHEGVLAVDLDAWMKGRTHPTAFMLDAARRRTGLWRVTLSDFTVEFRLGSTGTLVLGRVSGGARLTDAGGLRAELTGVAGGETFRVGFDVADDEQKLTVEGRSLPWVAKLLAPTVGEDVAGMLENPAGSLELVTGATGYNWQCRLTSALALERLPLHLGIGKLSGRPRLALDALGRLGESATCYAELTLDENETLSVSAAALDHLRFLLTGMWPAGDVPDVDHTVGVVSLSLFITPACVSIDSAAPDEPAGLFTPDGHNLLPLPMNRDSRIGAVEFIERLKTLRRMWQRRHTG